METVCSQSPLIDPMGVSYYSETLSERRKENAQSQWLFLSSFLLPPSRVLLKDKYPICPPPPRKQRFLDAANCVRAGKLGPLSNASWRNKAVSVAIGGEHLLHVTMRIESVICLLHCYRITESLHKERQG